MLLPAAALAGPPFVTDDPVPVDLHGWEINNAVSVITARDGTGAALPSIDINYGVLPGVQLHLQPQISANWGRTAAQAGIGDTQAGAKIRLLDEDRQGWAPMVSLYPIVTAPSGNAHRGLGTGTTAIFAPIWVDKTFGKWTVDGGGGPTVTRGQGMQTAWFAGALLLYQVNEPLALGGEVFQQTSILRGGRSAPGFNLGGSYDFTHTYHALFSAGRGLANQSETNRLAAYLALQVTF